MHETFDEVVRNIREKEEEAEITASETLKDNIEAPVHDLIQSMHKLYPDKKDAEELKKESRRLITRSLDELFDEYDD